VKTPILTIGIVLPYLKKRGTETQALNLAKGFVDAGMSVVVYVLQGWGAHEMYTAFQSAGIRVVDVGPPSTEGKKRVDPERSKLLADLARMHAVDLLLSRAAISNQVAGDAAHRARVPFVAVLSTSSISTRTSTRNPFKRFVNARRVVKKLGNPTRIISVSREGANRFAAAYPLAKRRIRAIPNGVGAAFVRLMAEAPLSGSLSCDRFLLCCSGSLDIKRKGLDTLLDALHEIVVTRGQDDVCLILVGSGEGEHELRVTATNLGVQNNVVFFGEAENPHAVVAKSDLFVLPSRREGMPNALLEAMALGVCCIAADCDTGPREIIDHMRTGLLVPVDDAECLAESILLLKTDTKLRNAIACAGSRSVERDFSLDKMVDGYLAEIYALVHK